MLKRSPWPTILQVVPELSAGGAERTAIEMAEAITVAGGRALVLSQGGRLEADLERVGGELIRFPARTKNPSIILFNAMRMSRLIKKRSVSLVHARSRAPAWSAFLAAWQTHRTFVTTYHGIYNQNSRVKNFYNGVMARGDAVICNSQYTAQIVSERHPDARDRLSVIHRGVDLEEFQPAAVSNDRVQALRFRWGIPHGARIVLLPARLTRWKGHKVLIEAISGNLPPELQKDTVFVLAGDEQGRSAYRQELDRMIRSERLEGKVVIAGHCDDMPAAFKAAVLTVIPSIEPEAFGRVSVEAQAMGCPVIAANIGALPETIPSAPAIYQKAESISAGSRNLSERILASGPWLFEAGNANALRDCLRMALSLDDEAMEPFRLQAIDHARSRFAKEILQLQTLKVYDRLLGTQLASAFQHATGYEP